MNQRRATSIGLFILLLFTLLVLNSPTALAQSEHDEKAERPQRSKLCPMHFEGTVHSGPSTGLSLIGVLTLEAKGSNVDGMLEEADGHKTPVQGRITRDDTQLTFDLGDN